MKNNNKKINNKKKDIPYYLQYKKSRFSWFKKLFRKYNPDDDIGSKRWKRANERSYKQSLNRTSSYGGGVGYAGSTALVIIVFSISLIFMILSVFGLIDPLVNVLTNATTKFANGIEPFKLCNLVIEEGFPKIDNMGPILGVPYLLLMLVCFILSIVADIVLLLLSLVLILILFIISLIFSILIVYVLCPATVIFEVLMTIRAYKDALPSNKLVIYTLCMAGSIVCCVLFYLIPFLRM